MILTAKDVATEILSTNTHYDFFFFLIAICRYFVDPVSYWQECGKTIRNSAI